MMHLKNITAGNARTREQYRLTKQFSVVWLFSEDGKNWYEEQKNFAADTIKIAYDKKNIIVNVSRDVSAINPEGLSVAELPDITANRRADNSGNWMFLDGKIVRRVYTPDELRQQAEVKKARLLAEAESVISPLARAVKLNMATDDELKRLEAWEYYSIQVSRVDPSLPEWPERPE